MSIGFLQYINKDRNSYVQKNDDKIYKEEDIRTEVNETDEEFNLSINDLFEFDNNTLFISQAGDYIKIINDRLHVYNSDKYEQVCLSKYWINEKYKVTKTHTLAFREVLDIIHKGTEYINVIAVYNGEHITGSLVKVLNQLCDKYAEHVLADAILNGIWKIQY